MNLKNGNESELISSLALRLMFDLNKPDRIQTLLSKGKQELVGMLIEEMETKNEALYFLMDQGLLDKFLVFTGSIPSARADFMKLISQLIKSLEQKEEHILLLQDLVNSSRRDVTFYQELIESMRK